jgi:hypothetical protein
VAVATGSVLASGACFGFFIGDELYAQGVLPWELTFAMDAVRGSFSRAITWANLCPYPPFSYSNKSMLNRRSDRESLTPLFAYRVQSRTPKTERLA